MGWRNVVAGDKIIKKFMSFRNIFSEAGRRGAKWIKMLRKTRKFCSNPVCCGNPRKLGEKTRQEIKADISFREQLDEIDM